MSTLEKVLAYYKTHGKMTDLGDQADVLSYAPAEIPALVGQTQNLLLHNHIAEWVYGVKLSSDRKKENSLKKVADRLARYKELGDSPLSTPRSHENRVVGTCRDFAVVMTAFLREKGIPARARCGFATYFMKPFEDHWVTEYWSTEEQRWVLIDAQIDNAQREKLKINFDTLNMTTEHFVNGAEAWQMCRSGEADPNDFGIFDMQGLWFVRGDLIRDLAALNKAEMLPWDVWGLIEGEDDQISADDLVFMDMIAALMLAEQDGFDEMRSVYASDLRVKPGKNVKAYTPAICM